MAEIDAKTARAWKVFLNTTEGAFGMSVVKDMVPALAISEHAHILACNAGIIQGETNVINRIETLLTTPTPKEENAEATGTISR